MATPLQPASAASSDIVGVPPRGTPLQPASAASSDLVGVSPRGTTLEIIDAVIARLKEKLPQLAVEYFPERPAEYRLNHPKGALLVSYPGSTFADTVDTQWIAQPRTVKLSVTVVLRQLNGKGGAVDVVDAVRLALVGFCPPDCRKVRAVAEKFLGETAGLWQYAVDLATQSMLVEDTDISTEPILTQVTYEEAP